MSTKNAIPGNQAVSASSQAAATCPVVGARDGADILPSDMDVCPMLDLDYIVQSGPPHEWLASLRKNDPVHHVHAKNESEPGFWLVTKRDDCGAVSRDWASYSSDRDKGSIVGLSKTERDQFATLAVEKSIPTMDPPEHTKYRKVVVNAMTPTMVSRLEPRIREISVRLINEALEKRHVDLVSDLAAWLPLEVLADLGGISEVDRKRVFRLVNTVLGENDAEYAPSPEQFRAAQFELNEYCMQLYEMRVKSPGDDVVSMMVHGSIDSQPITAKHGAAFLQLLLSAGSETTRNTIVHGVHALAEQPDQWSLLRKDSRSVMKQGVEEMLRWATPIMYFGRTCMKDVQLRGSQIKQGDHIILSYTSANRDEEAFREPMRFDLLRSPNNHVSFGGGGVHTCLGANLARLELRCFFEELAIRTRDLRLTGQPVRLRSTLFNGIKHLPLELVPN